MSTPKEGEIVARPRKEINQAVFEKLCGIQCTRDEICSFFGVTDKTLDSWCKRTYDGRGFSAVYAEKRMPGKISLRRYQFQLAEKYPAMAMFLGKNYLGQRDNMGAADEETDKVTVIIDV